MRSDREQERQDGVPAGKRKPGKMPGGFVASDHARCRKVLEEAA